MDDDICIYTNKATGTYTVTAQGSGTANNFTVSNGTGGTLSYSLFFNDQSGTTGEIQLTKNTTSSSQTGANISSYSCGGGTNANFHAKFLEADLLSAPQGTYSGTVTLIIEPI